MKAWDLLKAAFAPTARYDAGGNGRRVLNWRPPASGPRKAVEPGFEQLRHRVHDSVRNDWAARAATQKWVSNLIGVGVQPRWADPTFKAIWDEWHPRSDADGVNDAYGLQALLTRCLFDGGEVFLRRRPRDPRKNGIPVQIQLLEGAMCPLLTTDTWEGLPVGSRIEQGIELNRSDERVAFWFYKSHPGDARAGGDPGRNDLVRVAASQVSHVYEVERPGQLRGVSPLATILTTLRNAGDLVDTSLERQKIANLFAAFVTRPGLGDDGPVVGSDPEDPMPVGLEPGAVQELKPGEDLKFSDPPEPGVGFAEFLRGLNVASAAGAGLPYELMTGDIQNVSDRTLRVVINEFRRYCQQRQWLVLIPRACQPMVDWCMEAALLAGRLPAGRLAEAKRTQWVPQGWEYIHPVQDAQGQKLLLEMGLASREGLILNRGDDPALIDEQRARDTQKPTGAT